MKIAPVIKTERLLLRPMEESDAEDVFLWAHSPEVTKYLFYLPNRTIEDTKRLVANWVRRRRNESWVLVLDGHAIGELEHIKDLPDRGAELGYESKEEVWGHGYMKEAMKAVIRYLLDSGYDYLFAETDSRNERSSRLLLSLGFLPSGSRTKTIAKKHEEVVLLGYTLQKKE
jgi:ribosomal-protein-alanine N-acetyltransferase